MQIRGNKILSEEIIKFNLNYVLNYKLPQLFIKKLIKKLHPVIYDKMQFLLKSDSNNSALSKN